MIKPGRSFWWIVILVVATFFLSRVPSLADNPIYFRIFIVFILVLFVNGLWAGLSIIGIDLDRKTLSTRMQVGEILTEKFEVKNQSIIPKVWLKISDKSGLPSGHGANVLSWVGARQSRAYRTYTLLGQRGWYQLGPTKVETGDIFGILRFRTVIPSQNRLLVIPYTYDIVEFPAPYGMLPGGRALRQKTLEVTPYAAGVREFVPGDPLKSIHWPSSARKQKLIVKEFEKDPLAEVWIFLDVRGSVHYTKEKEAPEEYQRVWMMKQKQAFNLPSSTEEYAISIAASIAKYYIREKREVGFVAAGQKYAIFPAERGERQLGKIFETLAVIRARGEMPIWGLISSQVSHLARGSTIVIITPSADQKTITIVMELLHRGLMPVVVLIDQASFGGPQISPDFEDILVNQGIITYIVSEGENIKSVLEENKLEVFLRAQLRKN